MNQSINTLEGNSEFVFSVKITTISLNKVVSLRENISRFEDESKLWDKFEHRCIENNVKLSTNDYTYAITHNIDSLNNLIDTEVLRIVNL